MVYGPAETQDKGVTQVVGDGDRLSILGHDFSIFSTPGHTLGHICYYSEPYLFCGDTMFSFMIVIVYVPIIWQDTQCKLHIR